MRLQRGVEVAGVDPEVARAVVRACHGGATYPVQAIARWAKVDPFELEGILERLTGAGFLEATSRTDFNGGRVREWATTVRGGALANASFLKPISRTKADALLAGVVDRAAAYNADQTKTMWVERIAVFGSYLDEQVDELGDVDLQVTFGHRPAEDVARAKLDYAEASGRSFSSFMDQLLWAEREVRQLLKNRSGYLSIHTEDISVFTDRWQIVYERLTV